LLTPSYRLHRPSGQAIVRIAGKDLYLGRHGSPESKERYAALVADYLTAGAIRAAAPDAPALPTVNEIIAAYWQHLERAGRYMKAGEPTTERGWIRDALRALCQLFGECVAAEFGPKKLHALRVWMIEDAQRRGRVLSRTTINGRVRRIVRVFRWAVGMELVPSSVWHGLQAVPGLRRGESSQVRESSGVPPVAWKDVEATLAHVGRVVGAMIQLQWFTGMRPGEVCSIRAVDVDRSGDVWVYRPPRHKTQHHGQVCERLLGPRAQALLTPFLRRGPETFLFSPEESEAERNERRRRARVVSMWPSHERRFRPQGAEHIGACYTVASYRRAVERACSRAGIASWSPNQLRHARATEGRRRYGLEAAQVTLGHASADITQVYAERDRDLARRVALETG